MHGTETAIVAVYQLKVYIIQITAAAIIRMNLKLKLHMQCHHTLNTVTHNYCCCVRTIDSYTYYYYGDHD